VAGLALAGAMLIHQMASLFYPAALVAVISNGAIERKVRFAGWMTLLAWAIPVAVYYLCAALLHDLTSPLDVLNWALSNPTGVSLSSSPIAGTLSFPQSNFDAIVGHSFALFRGRAQWIEFAIALTAVITAIIFVLTALRKVQVGWALKSLRQCAPEMSAVRRLIVPVLIAWIATYSLFLIFWVPLVYYRSFYTPALALAFGFVITNYHLLVRNRPSGAGALAVAALALFNLAFYIGPYMRADSNALVAAARNANGVWNEGTVIYFGDRKTSDIAFQYFNPLTVWRKLSPAARHSLDREIDQIDGQGGSIWLNKGAAELVDPEWLAKHARGQTIEVRLEHADAAYVQLLPDE
jgi:hypothetical protein